MFKLFHSSPKPSTQPAPGTGSRPQKRLFPNFPIKKAAQIELIDLIQPYKPPPGVRANSVLAMDGAEMVSAPPDMGRFTDWLDNYYADGLGFFGYPLLSQMAQRPEYRKMVETLAKEATRAWIKITAKGTNKTQEVDALTREFERLQVREAFYRASEHDGFFGLAHILLDFGNSIRSSRLTLPIRLSPDSIGKGSLKRLITVEPIWTSPNAYSADEPFDPYFYKPKNWFVNSQLVDSTRLLSFVAREVPDLLKPSYNFGGMALTQLAKPYVDNWLRTRQSISDLINSFSMVNLQTSMNQLMQEAIDFPDAEGGASVTGLINRVQAFNQFRHNQGTFVTDKESEDLKNLAVPLGTLDKLQAQAQEQMASIASQPLIKMFGIQPSGLNASSAGEIRVWYDEVSSYQEHFFRPQLERLFKIVQLSLWGEIDPDLSFEFVPLWQLDEKSKTDLQHVRAQTDAIYIDNRILAPDEVRERLMEDKQGLYSAVDLTGPPPKPKPTIPVKKSALQTPHQKKNTPAVMNTTPNKKK